MNEKPKLTKKSNCLARILFEVSRRVSYFPKSVFLVIILTFLLSNITKLEAQPISFGEFQTNSKIVYRLSGIYNGNKTFEFVSIETIDGRTCILVRVKLDLRIQFGTTSVRIEYTSEFCYDERGRPVRERMKVPLEANSSIEEVIVEYWWGERCFPDKVKMYFHLKGNVTEIYELDMIHGSGIFLSGDERSEFSFTQNNLSEILPFVPEALITPYIDFSSIKFKKGVEKTFGEGSRRIKLKVLGLEYVDTPAGTFDCYKVLLEGIDEYGIPYNSTLYITKGKPRFTVMYETYSIGIKQRGWVVYLYLPKRFPTRLVIMVGTILALSALILIALRRRA